MATTTDDRGTVSFCHRCGYTEANNVMANRVTFHVEPTRLVKTLAVDWSDRAESIRRKTLPIRETLAQTYLEYRGAALPPCDSDLRYLPPTDTHPPSLCALVTDAVTGKPISLHFTRLAADGRGKAGTNIDKVLLAGHRKRGGVVRLWPDEAVATGLAIAEGIETALALAHGFAPVWSCIDAGNLAALPVLNGIESITIAADHDTAGLKAATALAQRWADAGREAHIVISENEGDDVADAVAA